MMFFGVVEVQFLIDGFVFGLTHVRFGVGQKQVIEQRVLVEAEHGRCFWSDGALGTAEQSILLVLTARGYVGAIYVAWRLAVVFAFEDFFCFGDLVSAMRTAAMDWLSRNRQMAIDLCRDSVRVFLA